jgi:hypothetical protein
MQNVTVLFFLAYTPNYIKRHCSAKSFRMGFEVYIEVFVRILLYDSVLLG